MAILVITYVFKFARAEKNELLFFLDQVEIKSHILTRLSILKSLLFVTGGGSRPFAYVHQLDSHMAWIGSPLVGHFMRCDGVLVNKVPYVGNCATVRVAPPVSNSQHVIDIVRKSLMENSTSSSSQK